MDNINFLIKNIEKEILKFEIFEFKINENKLLNSFLADNCIEQDSLFKYVADFFNKKGKIFIHFCPTHFFYFFSLEDDEYYADIYNRSFYFFSIQEMLSCFVKVYVTENYNLDEQIKHYKILNINNALSGF